MKLPRPTMKSSLRWLANCSGLMESLATENPRRAACVSSRRRAPLKPVSTKATSGSVKPGVSILTSGRFRSSTEPSRSYACKDRNSDTRAPARSVLAEPFNERSVDLRDRRPDDVVGGIGIDHHIGTEVIALQVFFNRGVS